MGPTATLQTSKTSQSSLSDASIIMFYVGNVLNFIINLAVYKNG